MNKKKYLIYFDILGFEKLAEEISTSKGIEARKIRSDFIKTLKRRVKILEKEKRIIGMKWGSSDDWLIVLDSLDGVFISIKFILDHNTGYTDYEKIPLEIAIGMGKYDKWSIFSNQNLIIENDTIMYLKSDIINYYHKWFKKYHHQSIKSTFILLNDSVFNELEFFDKEICQKIKYIDEIENKKVIINFFIVNVNKLNQRGRLIEFLEKIGEPSSKIYEYINEVYVQPLEYIDIVKILTQKRIVFITGTPEFGKTFTAVKLMWEYFERGYKPRWIKGGEFLERAEVRKSLENIETKLDSKHIIYLEDPFGKIKYERRETLEREIGYIINCIEKVKDVYLIITSREEVFKEFEKENLSSFELKEFEKKLNIKKPSYDSLQRKEIIYRHALKEDCKWIKHPALKELILKKIIDGEYLSTPLSIRNFAKATINIINKDKLIKILKEQSKEVAMVFANEIKSMSNDKILFLLFLFISNFFKIDFVKKEYQELLYEFNIKDPWEFDRVLNWFKDDKITISDQRLMFSHPSYYNSLEYLLTKNGFITQINKEIFSKLLLRLSERDQAVIPVAKVLVDNFDKLPKKVREELLIILSKNDNVASIISRIVVENFDFLPLEVRKILLRLSERDKAAIEVASVLTDNFDKLPKKDMEELLIKLSKKDHTALEVSLMLVKNLDRLSNEVGELLFKLSENDQTAFQVAWTVSENFDKLHEKVREELLLRLSDKDQATFQVVRVVAMNFDKLHEKVREELLLRLFKNDQGAFQIAWSIYGDDNKLPKELIKSLS